MTDVPTGRRRWCERFHRRTWRPGEHARNSFRSRRLTFGGVLRVYVIRRRRAFFSTLILASSAIALGILHPLKVNAGRAANQNLAVIAIGLGVLGLIIGICGGTTSVGHDIHNDIR